MQSKRFVLIPGIRIMHVRRDYKSQFVMIKSAQKVSAQPSLDGLYQERHRSWSWHYKVLMEG